ncbi:hypothetical protein BLA29_010480, partial [Euroglyphus maynei]
MTSTSSENVDNKIQQIRSIIIEQYERNKDLYYEKDIEFLLKDDWTVERFIQRGKTVDKSSQLLNNMLKVRVEMKMDEIKHASFPRELFKIGYVFNGGYDRQGNGLIFIRYRFYRKIKELDQRIKQFMCHQMEMMDTKTMGHGMAIIVDLRSIGLNNIDIDYSLWGINHLINCCPP